MERYTLVLDASVIVKWFTREDKRKQALDIREQFINQEIDILIPDLTFYEVSNALRFNTDFDEIDIRDAVESLFLMSLDIITPRKEILDRSIEISVKYNLSVYDSYYIALAELVDIDFVTSDKKLFEKVKNDFDFVRLL